MVGNYILRISNNKNYYVIPILQVFLNINIFIFETYTGLPLSIDRLPVYIKELPYYIFTLLSTFNHFRILSIVRYYHFRSTKRSYNVITYNVITEVHAV